jgi:hypothetical protein
MKVLLFFLALGLTISSGLKYGTLLSAPAAAQCGPRGC